MASLIDRLFGRSRSASPAVLPVHTEPKRLLEQTKAVSVVNRKASSMSLLPRGVYGANYEFFSADGRHFIEFGGDRHVAIALVAYWYVATRWRAQKLAEAPLMVVREDQETGDEEWLADHELVGVLDEPSPDYDMGELIEKTSHYLDNSGSCLWVMDFDRGQRVARLTPFSRNEFEIERSEDRLFQTFKIQTSKGIEEKDAEEVCFFKDDHLALNSRWGRGSSRLDVAMSWLRLGEHSRRIIHELLGNSIWPSIVVQPDKDWNPDPKTYNEYLDELEAYGQEKGRPFVALGGAQVTSLAAQLKDLVPSDILNRVEAVVASISGVPAVVLQYQVGLENSPWSQMAQARRMAYDDTIGPTWKKMERVLTRQILRPVDEDKTHFIRFDKSNIDALQRDRAEDVAVAVQMGRAATLNERRAVMGLEPATTEQDPDGRANDIPELTAPDPLSILAGTAGNRGSTPDSGTGNADNGGDTEDSAPPDKNKAARQALLRKFKAPALLRAFRAEAQPVWKVHINSLLKKDAEEIADLIATYITEASPESKSLETKARQKDRAMSSIRRYINEDSKSAWTKSISPLTVQAAQRGGAVIAADLNVSYTLLHPHVLSFAKATSGKLIKGVGETTLETVNRVLTEGLEKNLTTRAIAQNIRDSAAFSKERANLIARTETTKAFNGAPTASLAATAEATGRKFTKTWSGALDDRERDEHVALEGETVDVGDTFSNGLDFPSEPNCRCTVLFQEVDE